MAMNYLEMLSRLRMGVDVLPMTDPESVPHATNPAYVPTYTVRDPWSGEIRVEGEVDVLVALLHDSGDAQTLYEDEYPVMTVG